MIIIATGGVVTSNGRIVLLNRAYKGTADYTQMSRFKIGTGTTTPTQADTDLDTVIAGWAPGASDFKNFETGYPTFDEAAKTVTVRGEVLSTEANANTITEAGEFNTDGTPKMGSRDVFTGIAKISSMEIIFLWVHEITD